EAGLDVVEDGQLGGQDLERHDLVRHAVLRLVDHPHAALADDVEDAVDAEDELADEGARRRVVERRVAADAALPGDGVLDPAGGADDSGSMLKLRAGAGQVVRSIGVTRKRAEVRIWWPLPPVRMIHSSGCGM